MPIIWQLYMDVMHTTLYILAKPVTAAEGSKIELALPENYTSSHPPEAQYSLCVVLAHFYLLCYIHLHTP